MRVIAGTILNITAGTEVALSSHSAIKANDHVLGFKFTARLGNVGNAYVGINGMSSTDGWELQPGVDSPSINLRAFDGSVRADLIFVDVATSNDDVDFICVLE